MSVGADWRNIGDVSMGARTLEVEGVVEAIEELHARLTERGRIRRARPWVVKNANGRIGFLTRSVDVASARSVPDRPCR